MSRRAGPAAGAAAGLLLATGLLAGCSADQAARRAGTPGTSVATSGAGGPGTPTPSAAPGVDEPRRDSLYPEVGDPGVDALHYDLDLDWTPEQRRLVAREALRFRATGDAGSFHLDLTDHLAVSRARLDGRAVSVEHAGDDLVVRAPVRAGQEYLLELDYAGTPQPVPAPTTRSDIDGLGWTTTGDGEVATMQEPYGAHSWYAANDHPSDKARYDFELSVPAPWVGVANGELAARTRQGRDTVTRWHLAEPAAAYLVTVAFGDLVQTRDGSAGGVPISYWTPRDEPRWLPRLRETPDALAWVEQRLGPYPYDTLGIVLVDSRSGMETQTMITLGTTRYATSAPVLVHELVHHWYGNQVTPEDWRDLWMNEGMAMYLQWAYEAERSGQPLAALLDRWAAHERVLRRQSGPPGDFDADQFGASNVYFGGGLLWHEVRERVGEEAFWDAARAWPAAHDDDTADRDELVAWWEQRTGTELADLFDAWLMAEVSPDRG